MEELNLMFFGNIPGRINNVILSNALDNMAAVSNKYFINRENCIDIYEIFDDLRYDLSYLDMKLGHMTYNEDNEEYKFPLIRNGNKIGVVIIDKLGSARVIYDKLQAMDMDPIELEVQIEILLTAGKTDLIDAVMNMIQFTRPIPLNHDSFILYIDDKDKQIIMELLNEVFQQHDNLYNINNPYFVVVKDVDNNYEDMSNLITDKLNEVLDAFESTKEEFFNGLSEDLTADDLEVIDSLIAFTKEDAMFYEEKLNSNIVDKLNIE